MVLTTVIQRKHVALGIKTIIKDINAKRSPVSKILLLGIFPAQENQPAAKKTKPSTRSLPPMLIIVVSFIRISVPVFATRMVRLAQHWECPTAPSEREKGYQIWPTQ
jgi:hypothetical protein